MISVGELLRSARENQGRGLADIAEELCITPRYLRAIEADDVKVLPGLFFYKSFVRQYASLLGLDPKALQPALESAEPAPPPAVKPKPLEPPMPLVRAAAAAAAASLARFVDPSAVDPSYQAPVRKLDPIVAESNRDHFSDRRVGVSVAALLGALLLCTGFYAWWNRPHTSSASETPKPVTSVRNVSSSTAESPAVNVSQETDGIHVALNLSATEATWLSVTSDGKEIFSGVLRPSETKTLNVSEAAQMKVGNAGGLDVRWNGKAIGPIGRRGQVRTVMFTPQNVEIIEPAVPAPKQEAETDPTL
jgi:cytoskeleton protein RodZ